MDWAALQIAIRSWVATASGIEVIWEGDGGVRPATPYIALDFEVDNVGQGYNSIRDADPVVPEAEIEHFRNQLKRLELSVTCYGGTVGGNVSAVSYLDKVKDSSSMPTAAAALTAAGWTPAEFQRTQSIGAGMSANFEPRSQFLCHGFLHAQTIEAGTYIETVAITNDITGNEITVDITE